MKNFKQYLEESGGAIGLANQTSVSQDGDDTFDITNPSVLKRVNAFVGSIGDMEYIKPQQAVDSLREKLNRIGFNVSPVTMEGTSGKVSAKVTQFGGRFGKDTDGTDLNDDNISHKKAGGLNLEVSYETLKNGASKVYAKLV